MNNETQRHAVMSWCSATGAKHVFVAGTEPATSLLLNRTLLTSESLSILVLIAPSTAWEASPFRHGWTQANICASLWDMLGCAGHDMWCHTVTCEIVCFCIWYSIEFCVYDIIVVNLWYRMHMISYVGPKISYFGHMLSYTRYRLKIHIHTISYVQSMII